MANSIRVAVVDDHPLYREGVIFALEREPDIKVIAQGTSADDALRIARESIPDMVLIDLGMPGGGMSAVENLSLYCPGVKTLVLTVDDDQEQVSTALNRGAGGYLLKGASSKDLVDIIRRVVRGELYVPPAFAASMLTHHARRKPRTDEPPKQWPQFSPREEQILSRLIQNMSNKQIGDELSLSEKTVKHYVTALFQKLNVSSRAEAAWIAKKHNASEGKD
jgi:two-component system nitrate/nitrite response regulator NarL